MQCCKDYANSCMQTPVCRINDLLGTSLIILLNAPFIYLLVCLLVFNGWFNFTAELTRFADREFYQVSVCV